MHIRIVESDKFALKDPSKGYVPKMFLSPSFSFELGCTVFMRIVIIRITRLIFENISEDFQVSRLCILLKMIQYQSRLRFALCNFYG